MDRVDEKNARLAEDEGSADQTPSPSLATTSSLEKKDNEGMQNKLNEQLPQRPSGIRSLQMRIPVLILTMLALSSMMANVVFFNFVVLCMPGTDELNNANHTYIGYAKRERTLLFSATAVGAFIAVVPVSHATHSIGTRWVFFSAGLLSALSTALMPIASRITLEYFIVLRAFQGVAFAAMFPTVGSVTSRWASLGQHGLFMSMLTTFGQISAIFSMPVSGTLCVSSWGWESVFYLHAFLSLLIFVAWFLVYRNQPGKHPLITREELAEINAGKSTADLSKYDEDGQRKRVPYLRILATPAIWGVWMAALGDMVAVQLLHIFSPLYIRDIVGYSLQKTGWAAALPVLFQFFVKILGGHSSDRIKGISETTKLRVYNSLALGVSALFMIALAYVPRGFPTLAVTLMTASNGMFGFNGGGFNKCATLVSRQYSHFVMANIQCIWCLSMLISPVLVNFILVHGTLSEWRTIFLSHGVFLLVCNALFCALATAKPATWTNDNSSGESDSSVSKKCRPLFFDV